MSTTEQPTTNRPIIVTALLGAADFAWADGLRRAHFPAERNVLRAHLTLFHHLPPARLPELVHMLRIACRTPAPPARLTGIMSLGRGTAFRIESPDLLAIRQHIAEVFEHDLIPQDRGTPRLHVTVQNKVDLAAAKRLQTELAATFHPRPLAISGLAAWYYQGGPWQLAHEVKFRG